MLNFEFQNYIRDRRKIHMTILAKLDTHIINPRKPSIGTVIWMHGLGADQHDFDSLVPDFWLGDQLPLRFVFPNAPIRPVTINYQMPTRAWYDVYSLTDLNREDTSGIHASRLATSELIRQEIESGTPAHRIVIAGFSQGGAMALYTGVRQTESIGGILALSCYLPLFHEHPEQMHPNNRQTPILITHGTHDMTLPYFAGKMAYDIVRKTHPHTEWREYPMGHEIAPPVVKDIQQFLIRVFD